MNIQDFKDKYEKIPITEYPNNVPSDIMVSICVQTYQHADFISECLDSILSQKTNFSFEILLGEDESTDGTREICIKYAEKYPNIIRLFLHKRENNIHVNGKPTGRFNWINNLFSARGKYIAICEGDDYWTYEKKLQKQVDFLENNSDYNLVSHKIQTLCQDGSLKTKHYVNFSDGRYYLYRNFTYTLSILFRNIEKLKDLPEYFLHTQMADFPTNYYVSDSKRVKKFNKVMGVRRIHVGGVWSQLDNFKILDAGIEAREIMKEYLSQEDLPFLNAGLNRYRIKKFLIMEDKSIKPVLLKTSKYFFRHRAILALGQVFPYKFILKFLDKLCNI